MKKWMQRLSGICMILMLLLGMTAPGTELSALGGPAGQTALVVSSGSGRNRTMLTGKKKKKKNKNSSSNNNNNNSNNNNNNKNTSSETEAAKTQDGSGVTVEESGEYTSKEEVAAYLHEFGHLPDNFITKNEAKKLGWVNSEGNLDEVALALKDSFRKKREEIITNAILITPADTGRPSGLSTRMTA